MRNIKLFILIAFWVGIINVIHAQTSVSGGIYSNTTWVTANSPYVVVDTVVVFPGVTLTIEPGVTVKFENDKRLELRQAKLIALGTSTDSITFTSNSLAPVPGIWGNVWLNGGSFHSEFNYCNFLYATNGISHEQQDTLKVTNSRFLKSSLFGLNGVCLVIDSCHFMSNMYGLNILNGSISNCIFIHNQTGIHGNGGNNLTFNGYTFVSHCLLDSNQIGISGYNYAIINNCSITHNQIGVLDNGDPTGGLESGYSTVKSCVVDSNNVGLSLATNDSILNCIIKYNGVGLTDSVVNFSTGGNYIFGNIIENNGIGIKGWFSNTIICNKICNSLSYDFYNNMTINTTIPNNYWCTSDSLTVASKIYDGYDNINLGLVSFMPIDTIQCYVSVGIKEENTLQSVSAVVFPNPGSEQINILLSTFVSHGKIEVINLIGEIKYSSIFTGLEVIVNISDLPAGLHIVKINTSDGMSKQKFIKQ